MKWMMYLTGLEGTDQRSFVLSMLMLENSGNQLQVLSPHSIHCLLVMSWQYFFSQRFFESKWYSLCLFLLLSWYVSYCRRLVKFSNRLELKGCISFMIIFFQLICKFNMQDLRRDMECWRQISTQWLRHWRMVGYGGASWHLYYWVISHYTKFSLSVTNPLLSFVMGHQLGAQGPQDQLEGFDQLEIGKVGLKGD